MILILIAGAFVLLITYEAYFGNIFFEKPQNFFSGHQFKNKAEKTDSFQIKVLYVTEISFTDLI